MIGLLSTQPKYNDIIAPFIAISPVVYIDKWSDEVKQFITIVKLALKSSAVYQNILGGAVFPAPNRTSKFRALDSICRVKMHASCAELFNDDPLDPKINHTRDAVVNSMFPQASSFKTVKHYMQSVESRTFSMYDYGSRLNKRHYNSPSPPKYRVGRITNKHMAFISSLDDEFATPDNVSRLRRELSVELIDDYVIRYKNWTHSSFINAMQTGIVVNAHILHILEKYQKQLH